MIPISRTSKIAEAILGEENIVKNNLKLLEKQISKLLGIKVILSITEPVGMGIGIESNDLTPEIKKMVLSVPEILQQILVREFLYKIENIKVVGRIGVIENQQKFRKQQKFHLNFTIECKTESKTDTLREYVGDFELNKEMNKLEGKIIQAA